SKLPKFRKELAGNRAFQVCRSFAPAGAGLCTDHSLDHLNMPQPPKREYLIHFNQALRQQKQVVVLFGFLEDPHQLTDPLLAKAFPVSSVAWSLRQIKTPAPQQAIKRVAKSRPCEPGFQSRPLGRALLKHPKHSLIL